jgi:hypothetical protein
MVDFPDLIFRKTASVEKVALPLPAARLQLCLPVCDFPACSTPSRQPMQMRKRTSHLDTGKIKTDAVQSQE